MRIPLVLSAFALVVSIAADAQPFLQEQLTYLNDKGKETKDKKATVLIQVVRLNDTLWETNTYRNNGPMVLSIQRRTSDDNGALNGSYVTYSADGWADTLGYLYKGLRQGSWMVLAKNRTVRQIHYADGRILWQKDSMQLHRDWDSLVAARKREGKPLDTVESEFPGGAQGWLHYLNTTLRYPDEAVDKELMGTVVVGFNVDKEGSVPRTSIWVRRSASCPLDREALRVIQKSGDWTPAVQFGEKVSSYKLQPIVFMLEAEPPKKGKG